MKNRTLSLLSIAGLTLVSTMLLLGAGGTAKKYRNVSVSVATDEAAYVPGEVINPVRQSYQDAPNGLQLRQEYIYYAGARYQYQARKVGEAWQNVGSEFSYTNDTTYGLQIIFAEQTAWQVVRR